MGEKFSDIYWEDERYAFTKCNCNYGIDKSGELSDKNCYKICLGAHFWTTENGVYADFRDIFDPQTTFLGTKNTDVLAFNAFICKLAEIKVMFRYTGVWS